jgi:hypothetical protein
VALNIGPFSQALFLCNEEGQAEYLPTHTFLVSVPCKEMWSAGGLSLRSLFRSLSLLFCQLKPLTLGLLLILPRTWILLSHVCRFSILIPVSRKQQIVRWYSL